jgi:Cu2+-exporting ATPase
VEFDPQRTELRSLAERIAAVGYTPRPVGAPPPRDDLLVRMGVAAFCTANLMLLTAGLYAGWLDGIEPRFAALFRWGALALATPIATYSAAPFVQGALRSLAHRAIGMDVPIALAVVVLYLHGIAQTLAGAEGYLDSLGMLVTLLLAGRVLESRGRRAAAEASAAIASSLPATARRIDAFGRVDDVPVDELRQGDQLIVGAGQELPADGTVTAGEARVQMALLTGESQPVCVGVGDEVVAGAVLEGGSLQLRVDAHGDQTLAMRMAAAVREATARPLPDDPSARLAPAFTAVTVALAVGAGLLWTLAVDAPTGLQVAVATLVVACPCALGLSAPLSLAAGLGAVARRGVLLRDGRQLLALARVRHLALDKTGTVTTGRPQVLAADDEVLRVAAALERSSHHPIAVALLDEARRRDLSMPVAEGVEEHAGEGVSGRVDGRAYRLCAAGPGAVALHGPHGLVGLLHLGDRPRPDAAAAVASLRRAGLRVTLLSGDHPQVTDAIARAVGVDEAHGGCRPDDKVAWLRAHRAAFVGDGLNDGPALAHATVALAMHSGVTASLLVADGVVTRPALRPVVAALAGARATEAAMQRNTRRALVYNAVAVGAAIAGLINPLVAAVLMPLSSAWIIAGALRVPRDMERLEATWTSC